MNLLEWLETVITDTPIRLAALKTLALQNRYHWPSINPALTTLLKQGAIERIGRGLYRAVPDEPETPGAVSQVALPPPPPPKISLLELLLRKIKAGAGTLSELKRQAESMGYSQDSVTPSLMRLVEDGKIRRKDSGDYIQGDPQPIITDLAQIEIIETGDGDVYRLAHVASWLGIAPYNLKPLFNDDDLWQLYPAGEAGNTETYITRKALNVHLLQSRAAPAIAFRKWLGEDVLESVHETGTFEHPRDPGVQVGLEIARIYDRLAKHETMIKANQKGIAENRKDIDHHTEVLDKHHNRVDGLEREVRLAPENEMEALENRRKSIAKGRKEQDDAANEGFGRPYKIHLQELDHEVKDIVGKSRFQDFTVADCEKAMRYCKKLLGEAFSHRECKYPKFAG